MVEIHADLAILLLHMLVSLNQIVYIGLTAFESGNEALKFQDLLVVCVRRNLFGRVPKLVIFVFEF